VSGNSYVPVAMEGIGLRFVHYQSYRQLELEEFILGASRLSDIRLVPLFRWVARESLRYPTFPRFAVSLPVSDHAQ
jgi:hypothetical protein